jgi:hypothetical protein
MVEMKKNENEENYISQLVGNEGKEFLQDP